VVPALVSATALFLAACGGDDGVSANSVAADIEDQTPYMVSGCTEASGAGQEGGKTFTCTTATVPGGGPAGPPPGEDATITVAEEDGSLTATVLVGGQIVDFTLE